MNPHLYSVCLVCKGYSTLTFNVWMCDGRELGVTSLDL